MSVLEFIAQLIDALAWPAVVLAFVMFLRPHFGQILGLLRTVKYKEFEMTFGEATPGAGPILERYWMPDGSNRDAVNEARLRKWMQENGLGGVSITTLLNAGAFDRARRQAVVDLDLGGCDQGGEGVASG